jgi:hypothetical protein
MADTPRPLFSKRHYTWLAKTVSAWPVTQQLQLAVALYGDNGSFKAVRWFQAMGYDRSEADALADKVIRMFNKMEV